MVNQYVWFGSQIWLINWCDIQTYFIWYDEKFIALSSLEYGLAFPGRNVIYDFTKPSFDCWCMIKFYSPFPFQILNSYVYTYRERGMCYYYNNEIPNFRKLWKFEISFLSNESWWIEEDISFMCIVMFINWCGEKEKVC